MAKRKFISEHSTALFISVVPTTIRDRGELIVEWQELAELVHTNVNKIDLLGILTSKTNRMLDKFDQGKRTALIKEIVIIVSESIANKKGDEKYDVGSSIIKESRVRGNYSEDSRHEKSTQEQVYRKIELLKEYRGWLETYNPTKGEVKTQVPKTLEALITLELVEKIKTQYKGIGGKRLKLLLIALKEESLFPKVGMDLRFHTACTKAFNWDTRSYEAMRKYAFNDRQDKEVCELMKDFLRGSLIEIESTKNNKSK